MRQQFFQGFIPQQEMVVRGPNLTSKLSHNLLVLELYNNWENVVDLILRIEEEQEIQVNLMEKEWIDFINKNNLDIKSYETNEDFIKKNLKPLVKDKM